MAALAEQTAEPGMRGAGGRGQPRTSRGPGKVHAGASAIGTATRSWNSKSGDPLVRIDNNGSTHMKRLVTLTSTVGKTPEQLAAEVTASVAKYEQAAETTTPTAPAPPRK